MSFDKTRREVLHGLGLLGGAVALGPQVVGATPAEDRWVCDLDADGMSREALEDGEIDVVEDLADEVGYCMVECSEDHLPVDCDVDFSDLSFEEPYTEADFEKEGARELKRKCENGESLPYVPDIELELAGPEAARESGLNARNTSDEPLYDFQWDKQAQKVGKAHRHATGDGARIGIIDSGILGADPTRTVSHPDLPNVNQTLSENFTLFGGEPGPASSDHGTHVAGIAAAANDDTGVVGVAPDAELVDMPVFPGGSTTLIASAIVYGATPEDDGGAGCDVVNLSLGLGPLPVCSLIGLLILIFYYPLYEAAGQYALDNDCLAVTSAGNSSSNLADPYANGFCAPPFDIEFFGESGYFTLPASVDEFLTVSATGPIGYGWSAGGNGKGKGGSNEVGDTGFALEHPIQTEQFPEEPAFYTEYGGDGEVNVSAAGGNVDLDALDDEVDGWFYDLVFNTTFTTEDGDLAPSYGWKAGTSMASPQVAGLAALVRELDPDASAREVWDIIESTASQHPVGKSGSTTAPDSYPDLLGTPENEGTNVGEDGSYDGDQPSNPGSNAQTLDSTDYRGAGHIDIRSAVRSVDD